MIWKRLEEKSPNLVKKENISQNELNEVKKWSELFSKILKKLAQLRNIETTDLKRPELLHILMRAKSIIKKKIIWVIYKLILLMK